MNEKRIKKSYAILFAALQSLFYVILYVCCMPVCLPACEYEYIEIPIEIYFIFIKSFRLCCTSTSTCIESDT